MKASRTTIAMLLAIGSSWAVVYQGCGRGPESTDSANPGLAEIEHWPDREILAAPDVFLARCEQLARTAGDGLEAKAVEAESIRDTWKGQLDDLWHAIQLSAEVVFILSDCYRTASAKGGFPVVCLGIDEDEDSLRGRIDLLITELARRGGREKQYVQALRELAAYEGALADCRLAQKKLLLDIAKYRQALTQKNGSKQLSELAQSVRAPLTALLRDKHRLGTTDLSRLLSDPPAEEAPDDGPAKGSVP